jgi:hypothetical protein
VAESSASGEIDEIIAALSGWRGLMLGEVRRLIREADPEIVEEIKWRKPSNPAGVPVWSRGGIICTGEAYKGKVKLTFAKGASLPDPRGLLNGSRGGNTMRAMDIFEDDELDPEAFQALVRAAVAHNLAR